MLKCMLLLSSLFGAVEKEQNLIVPACDNVAVCGHVGELTGWRYVDGKVMGWGTDGDGDMVRAIKSKSRAKRKEYCAANG